MRTAIAWLEEAVLVSREENQAQVFPSSLRVSSVEEARIRLERKDITEYCRAQLLTIAETLIDADPDEGISTDELIGISGLKPEDFLRRWLPDRDKEVERQTTPESWRAIVESLDNLAQQRIVADDREQTNVLVLAGPAPARPGCWCTASPTSCAPDARTLAESWRWPTIGTPRSRSGAALPI